MVVSKKPPKFIYKSRKQPQNLGVLGLMGCSDPRIDIGAFTKEGI